MNVQLINVYSRSLDNHQCCNARLPRRRRIHKSSDKLAAIHDRQLISDTTISVEDSLPACYQLYVTMKWRLHGQPAHSITNIYVPDAAQLRETSDTGRPQHDQTRQALTYVRYAACVYWLLPLLSCHSALWIFISRCAAPTPGRAVRLFNEWLHTSQLQITTA